MSRCWDKGKTKIVGGHFEKSQPFCFWDKSAMALYLKIFVRPYSNIVPNFKFLSQSVQFPQILRIPPQLVPKELQQLLVHQVL